MTSRLSPHLRWGEVSPLEVWHALRERRSRGEGANRFRTELGWREFAWHVLFHAPELATRNWRAEFDAFPWPRLHPTALRAWEEGRTGVPLVDAGMRELWATGTHAQPRAHGRRVVPHEEPAHRLAPRRAVVLGHARRRDAASNPFNWQWVAGSGADAAPYFRVFNPELQATKFDPDGEYVRRWVPEVGTDEYPEPIVDLKADPRGGARRVRAREGGARLGHRVRRAASRTSGRRRPRR